MFVDIGGDSMYYNYSLGLKLKQVINNPVTRCSFYVLCCEEHTDSLKDKLTKLND